LYGLNLDPRTRLLPEPFALAIAGALGGLLAMPVVSASSAAMGEGFAWPSALTVVSLGLLTGLLVFGLDQLARRSGFSGVAGRIHAAALMTALLVLSFGGLMLSPHVTTSVFVIAAALATCTLLGTSLLSIRSRRAAAPWLRLAGTGVGSGVGALYVTIALLWTTNHSLDPSLAVVQAFFLALVAAPIGGAIWLARERTSCVDGPASVVPRTSALAAFAIVSVVLIPLTAQGFWRALDLHASPPQLLDETLLECGTLAGGNPPPAADVDAISALEGAPEKDITVLATLASAKLDQGYADAFRSALLDETRRGEFLDRSDTVKAWQFEVALRAHHYVQVSQRLPDLFSSAERQEILAWFEALNEKAFDVTAVDYAYALVFRRQPHGLYDNQEIGAGFLAVLSHILEPHNPELVARNREFIDRHAVGWRDNFRNPDDGIVYHQQFWIQNAYLLARYAGVGEVDGLNSRRSFDWILAQWPPNGQSPAYNVLETNTAFDVMLLGAALLEEPSYRWLAERMVLRDQKQGTLATGAGLLGAELWDADMVARHPHVGSCYLRAPTGIATRPGEVQPDKVVMREGWREDDLYALLNLRFAGWHGYKATNTVVTLMAGAPFVVSPMDRETKGWLPKAGAQQRDRRIDRTRLNGLQIRATGLDRAVFDLTRFGSSWRQDVPRFADVVTFATSNDTDIARTTIHDWGGVNHERAIVLTRESYVAVLDHVHGRRGEATINWFLKGTAQTAEGRLDLRQESERLSVYYTSDADRDVRINDLSSSRNWLDIHEADLELRLDVSGSGGSHWITVFSKDGDLSLVRVDAMDADGRLADDAFAVRISSGGADADDIIGRNDSGGMVRMGNLSTDAEFFHVTARSGELFVAFDAASELRIALGSPPDAVRIDGATASWWYRDGEVIIRPAASSGFAAIVIDKGADLRSHVPAIAGSAGQPPYAREDG
jgi:hypothetical protein